MQDQRKRKAFYGSIHSTGLRPLDISMYREMSLRQMVAERMEGRVERRVGMSWDFTRCAWGEGDGEALLQGREHGVHGPQWGGAVYGISEGGAILLQR